jgi:multicomponent Na+:H+ antiporter subunit G
MDDLRAIIGMVFIGLGVFFFFVGIVGVYRLPDTYSRLHATGKIATLGVFGIVIGVGVAFPPATLKVILLAIFMLGTGPAVSHTIAAAVHRSERARAGDGPAATPE